MRNPATSHSCTCEPADVDPHDVAHAVRQAETAALNAARVQANRVTWTTTAAMPAAHHHGTLIVCEPSLAEWLIHDGRARRDPSDRVCLDTRPLRHLPDIVAGGAPALEAYLNAFAAALTRTGYGVHLLTPTTTRGRRRAPPAREPPDATRPPLPAVHQANSTQRISG